MNDKPKRTNKYRLVFGQKLAIIKYLDEAKQAELKGLQPVDVIAAIKRDIHIDLGTTANLMNLLKDAKIENFVALRSSKTDLLKDSANIIVAIKHIYTILGETCPVTLD